MDAAVLKEIEQLRSLPVSGLRQKCSERTPLSNHKDYLHHRIARRLQAYAEGDLSERAQRERSG